MSQRLPITLATLTCAVVGLSGCMPVQQRVASPEPQPVVGAAVSGLGGAEACIPLSAVREKRVVDDNTIDFIRDGKRAWRSTLPQRCNGLKSANAFSYSTSLTQLCSTDIIHPLETAGGLHEAAGCGLGPFVPIALDQ